MFRPPIDPSAYPASFCSKLFPCFLNATKLSGRRSTDRTVRLWSLHPSYLDAQGLVALWREALLAQKVLRGRTKGYRHHPQLERFKARPEPVKAIGGYLKTVLDEASRRGYAFDGRKIIHPRARTKLTVTRGQLLYECRWLRAKLKRRSPALYRAMRAGGRVRPNPVFRAVPGAVAGWERT